MNNMIDVIAQLNKERSGDYGHPLPNFLRISLLWSIMHAPKIFSPIDVVDMMVLMKEARLFNDVKIDSYLDVIGYVNCIDLMCELYMELDFNNYNNINTGESRVPRPYKEINDSQKQGIIFTLKNLDIDEQWVLLNDSIKYLEGQSATEKEMRKVF